MKLVRAEKGVEVGRLHVVEGGCRAVSKGDKPSGIRGIAAPWKRWTVLYESPSIRIREQYQRGCFDESLYSQDDIRCMYNHTPAMILGRRSAKTLRLADTDEGLEYEVEINSADPEAMAVLARVARGDVAGASTWFMPTEIVTEESRADDGKVLYDDTIVKAMLYEAGPVTDGQYEDATATARSLERQFEAEREAEYREFYAAMGAAGGNDG